MKNKVMWPADVAHASTSEKIFWLKGYAHAKHEAAQRMKAQSDEDIQWAIELTNSLGIVPPISVSDLK